MRKGAAPGSPFPVPFFLVVNLKLALTRVLGGDRNVDANAIAYHPNLSRIERTPDLLDNCCLRLLTSC